MLVSDRLHRLRGRPLSLLVSFAIAARAAAAPEAAPYLASPAPPTSLARRSAMSAAIAASLPRYQPVALPPATASSGSEGVVLLPKLIVRDKTIPAFSERESHTRIGLGDLLVTRYIGASIRSQYVGEPHTYNYALQMYHDDERLAARQYWTELADSMRRSGDVIGAKDLKKELEAATPRQADWRTERIDLSANNGRR